MRSYSRYVIPLLLLCSAAAQADITEAKITADCEKITDYASQGEREYQAKNYDNARKAFEEQVSWSEQCDLPQSALATAYNNVAMALIHMGEYRRAQAWLTLAPQDSKSRYNLEQIKEKLAASPFPDTPAGEWWQYAGRGIWERIRVTSAGEGKIGVDFEGYTFGLMGVYSGPNMGQFSAKNVPLQDNNATVSLREDDGVNCDIHLHFTPQQLTVTTDRPRQCGFGHNVRANGTWIRVK